MTTGLIISIVVIFFLLVLSAFFSGSETALTAVSSARMHSAEKDGDKKAALVNKILGNKERMIGGLLLGNNIVNITASSLAAGTLISIFGDSGVVYASAAMTILVVIFSEVLPKTYALHHADNMARIVAPIVYAVIYVCAPITAVITKIVRASLAIVGVDISKVQAGSHLEMLRGVIDMHTGPDEEVQKQRAMLRSILDLADVTVDEVMIHRKNVVMLDLDDPAEMLVDEIMKCPYSRIPLYRESPDNIVGVIHTKWLMRELKAVGGDVSSINLEAIASEPWFIPDTTVLYDQLQAFRERGEHFAFIVDEYGSFEGIVTLEDILEEIVGEISDEHDNHITGVRPQPNGTYMVNGDVTIRDLRRELDWELPDDDYTTVAGLLLYETRQIPKAGQKFKFHGFDFEVARRQRNQIALVRITPPLKEMSGESSLQ
ncbi:MAG: HlyC/CorC family transporter [Pseudobdellovibrionaceae bacterium]|jgi:Mg2+/Co2+ transporter CorB|nr:HlyC/CorC family transporter [Pseudobdellovibrionaceae bacterium]